MKSTLTLIVYRCITIGISIVINIFAIKFLSIDEIAKYYIITAVAYFGNALFFVGFDFVLQRKNKNISITGSIDYASLRSYLYKVLPYGFCASFVMSATVSIASRENNWLAIALICAVLSAINFIASLLRNILQIAGEKLRISYSMLAEQLIKLGLSVGMVLLFGASALAIVMAFISAGLVSAAFNFYQMTRCLVPVDGTANYTIESNDLFKILLPVGASGVLNWLQLQAYRPVLGQFLQQTELVGAVSFLTMLGATVASAFLGVLAQVWTSKQFASNGEASGRFVQSACVLILSLVLIAYPVAFIFLRLLKKDNLYGLEYLVSLGVIIEGGNFILGVLGNHASLTRRSFVPTMVAGLVGFAMILFITLAAYKFQWIGPGPVGFGLALSQCIAVVTLLPVLLRKNISATSSRTL